MAWGVMIEFPGDDPDRDFAGVVVGPFDRDDAVSWAANFNGDGEEWSPEEIQTLVKAAVVQIVDPDQVPQIDPDEISAETLLEILRDRYDEHAPEHAPDAAP